MKKPFSKENTGFDGFTTEFYQTFVQKANTNPTQIFWIIVDGTLPYSFCKASVILIQKSDKDISEKKKNKKQNQKQKLQANIPEENLCKKYQQISNKVNLIIH